MLVKLPTGSVQRWLESRTRITGSEDIGKTFPCLLKPPEPRGRRHVPARSAILQPVQSGGVPKTSTFRLCSMKNVSAFICQTTVRLGDSRRKGHARLCQIWHRSAEPNRHRPKTQSVRDRPRPQLGNSLTIGNLGPVEFYRYVVKPRLVDRLRN